MGKVGESRSRGRVEEIGRGEGGSESVDGKEEVGAGRWRWR